MYSRKSASRRRHSSHTSLPRRRLSLEVLESRNLLSIGLGLTADNVAADPFLASWAAFQSGDKGHSGNPLAKVGDELADIYAGYQSADSDLLAGGTGSVLTSDIALLSIIDPTRKRVLIDASSVTDDPSALKADLAELRFTETGTFGRMVSGWLPIDQIDDLSALADLKVASAVLRPQTNVGAVTSEGDQAMRSDIARSTFGVNGSGIKVGLLSDSFNSLGGYPTDVATGDLPSGVQILQDIPDGWDEGRAMSQIVYDVAPGSSLAFATAALGQASFASHIEELAAAGCQVITDDVIYFEEPFFQDGVIAQAVNAVANQGVSYFSSAGNQDRQGYQATFKAGSTFSNGQFPSASGAPHFYGGVAHDFDPGAGLSNFQSFTLPNNGGVLLEFQWDQPFASVSGTGSANDVDIYLLNGAKTQVLAGSVTDNLGGDPSEIFQFVNSTGSTQTYNLMILCYAGPVPGLIKYVDFYGDMGSLAFATNSGTTYGHANTVGAASVGAAYYGNTPRFGVDPPVLESFSSSGGTPILFTPSWTRLPTPLDLHKTDFVAPDGVSTTVPGFESFYGTSAAAPHAAGVAALMKQFESSLTPAQIDTHLAATAIPMANPFAPAYNYAAGAGLIQADAALQSIPDIVVAPFPVPLTSKPPLGSLMYDRSASSAIYPSGDTDTFTLDLDASQKITVLVTPSSSGLRPSVRVLDRFNREVGSKPASSPGQPALLQTAFVAEADTYKIIVSGADSTVGAYTVQVTLNAGLEREGRIAGDSNNNTATAQDINDSFVDGSFLSPAIPLKTVRRGAVAGSNPAGAPVTISLTDFESGQAGYGRTGLWHLSTRRGTQAGHSPLTSFYYGSEVTGTYDTGAANAGSITSPVIALPAAGSISLSFNYVLQTESDTDYDKADVRVSTNGFATYTTIGSRSTNLPNSSSWTTFTADISAFAGTSIQIRWLFDTVDSLLNGYEGWYVDDVRLSTPGTWSDYYSMTLAAGDVVTVGLKNLAGTGTNISLLDPTGVPVPPPSTGPTGNLDKVISLATIPAIPASGTYYILVTGTTGATYNVIVTRNAAFDTEPNDSFTTAQSLDGVQGALGNLGAVGSASSHVLYYMDYGYSDPFSQAMTNLGIAPTVATSYSDFATKLNQGGWDLAVLLDQNEGSSTWVTPMVNWVGQGGRAIVADWYRFSSVATAFGASYTGAVNGDPVTITQPSHPVWSGFSGTTLDLFNPGWFTFSMGLHATTGTSIGRFPNGDDALIVGNNGRTLLNGFLSDTPANATERVRIAENEIRFLAPDTQDWYSINVTATANRVSLTTSTPADGPGEFVNNLQPKIELYNSIGILVASGTVDPDGRNETIVYVAPSPGIYRVRVSAKNSTQGEYFLSARVAAAWAVDKVTIDDDTAQRSRVRSIKVDFNGPIQTAPASAFTLKRTCDGALVGLQVSLAPLGNGKSRVTLTFTSGPLEFGSLADGRYTLSIDGSQIRDEVGHQVDAARNGTPVSTRTDTLHRFFGDANGDRLVDATDYLVFRDAYLRPVHTADDSAYDFNGDGIFNTVDLQAFTERLRRRWLPC